MSICFILVLVTVSFIVTSEIVLKKTDSLCFYFSLPCEFDENTFMHDPTTGSKHLIRRCDEIFILRNKNIGHLQIYYSLE